ncbi:MAG: hypothetical protein LC650_04005 [Actinobacteria bacterium]|nr:hypothetical protein [Actinomycetota bacterium]
MAKRYLLDTREYPAGQILLYSDGVVVKLHGYQTDDQREEITQDAKIIAGLANKPVPVVIEAPE